MIDYLKYFFIAAALFCLLDFIWLGKVAKNFYRRNLGGLLSDKPNLIAAVIFYVLFIIGLLVFAIGPARNDPNASIHALLFGALYGFFTYATYDLTNLATLKAWPVRLAIVDIIWGVALSGSIAFLTALIAF